MRKLTILAMFAAISLTVACSNENKEYNAPEGIQLKEITATLASNADLDVNLTRSGVVSTTDPTSTSIAQRGALGWKLDVQLYYGVNPYPGGANTYVWNGVSTWIPQTNPITYYPNYTNQTGKFTLYATAPNTPIATDQSDATVMLNQDQLYTSTAVVPTHIVNVTLTHAQSMLDFTFQRVPLPIQSVRVLVGATTYTPYLDTSKPFHYLLILPSVTTTENPVIVVTTNGGTVYKQTVNIIRNTSIGNPSALGVNSRYVFSLTGLQLGLSPISVVDWISGGSVAGGNVANTAYPTFRGPASTNCILTFSNGLSQTISFNSQGEYTVKPVGRTIVQVEVNGNTCPANLILGQMIIDLNALIAQCTPDN